MSHNYELLLKIPLLLNWLLAFANQIFWHSQLAPMRAFKSFKTKVWCLFLSFQKNAWRCWQLFHLYPWLYCWYKTIQFLIAIVFWHVHTFLSLFTSGVESRKHTNCGVTVETKTNFLQFTWLNCCHNLSAMTKL